MRSRNRIRSLLFFSCLAGLADGASAADERHFTISAGLDYSIGDYGESEFTGAEVDDTQTWNAPFSLKYEQSDWTARVTIPYVRIDGPSGLTFEDGVPVFSDDGGEDTTESGWGDVVASLAYAFYPQRKILPVVELTGRVKIPTADEAEDRDGDGIKETAGLGTGEWDSAIQLDVSKALGPLHPFVAGGYRFRGARENGWFGSVGVGLALGPALSVGVVYDFIEPSRENVVRDVDPDPNVDDFRVFDVEDTRELSPYLNLQLTEWLTLQMYGVIGLSDSSPDYGGGMSLALRF